MNAGIAFISRKSRKTDVAWRYAIAVVLVVCCIGLAYVEIVVAPWFINEVVSMFPETTLLKEPSMFWEWAILLAVQATFCARRPNWWYRSVCWLKQLDCWI